MLKFKIGDVIQSKISKRVYEIVPCPPSRAGAYDYYVKSEKGYIGAFNRIDERYYVLLVKEVPYDPSQQKDRDDDL